MPLPIIPLLCLGSILAGAGCWGWYNQLAAAQKTLADQNACKLAMDLFGKALNQLSAAEATKIVNATKRLFVN